MEGDASTTETDQANWNILAQSRNEKILRHQEAVKQILAAEKARREAEEKAKAEREAAASGVTTQTAFAEDQTPPEPPAAAPAMPPGILPPGLAIPVPVSPASGSPAPMGTYLRVHPPDVTTLAGELFDTEVVVINDQLVPFDEIELWLKYPSQTIQLIEVSDATLRPRLAASPVFENEPTSGSLYYHAALSAPYHFKNQALLRLRWRARALAATATIGFTFGDGERTTALRMKGASRLGTEKSTDDGAIAGNVTVDLPARRSERPIVADVSSYQRGRIRLRMTPDRAPVQAGEEVVVTVAVENPSGEYLDTARIRLGFDARIMTAIDWDRGNWIKKGVNVQDAFAREQFPFSFHRANEADNTMGTVDYEMGMEDRFVPPGGELFKVKFQALAPAADNAIWFDITPFASAPATALFSEGQNVLDYAGLIANNRLFLSVPILPAPQKDVVAGAPPRREISPLSPSR